MIQVCKYGLIFFYRGIITWYTRRKHHSIKLMDLFYFNRVKFNDEDDEFLIESFDGNLLREWRAVPDAGPWSYSRISRVFEDKGSGQQAPNKAVVLTGNVNLHSASKPTSLSYDCRTSMVNGQVKNPDCLSKTRRRNRIKREPHTLR